VVAVVAGLSIGLAGCGGDDDVAAPPSATESPAPSTSGSTATTQPTAVDPLASPTIEGVFEVADDGRRLNLTCWGEGSPTVVLEAGHPDGAGVSDFGLAGAPFTRLLAADTRVCAYDRAGWGGSDPAPNEPRTADDVIEDLEALLQAADVGPPYVLVGSSFGGMVSTYYAATHPDDVAGVVLLDVPAPDASLTAAVIPEIAWDHPSNLEHVDAGPEFENRFANDPVSFPAPLTVVTATGGFSGIEDQAVWLEASPDARQIELEGGHEIYLDDPEGAAAEVLNLVSGTEAIDAASTDTAATELIGWWRRSQTCDEMLAAFQQAGLAESHVGWLQGNFFGGEPGPTDGDVCAGAQGPLEHAHFFTAAGAFGSHDENGEEVDHGDFALVDDDTVSFPSHATEFGYPGDLVANYSLDGDVVTFEVALPEMCVDACADAYAWALSAFASGPWERGEVP
jgi:pimeloyl-ACP methyl ester carboxylesterase